MNIGIDLDDVTVGFIDYFLSHFNKKTGKNKVKKDIFSYNLANSLSVNPEFLDELFDEIFGSDMHLDLKPMDKAVESIQELSKNHKITLITARPIKFKEKTEKWLKQNSLNNFELIFSTNPYIGIKAKKKADICIEKGISIMLEDNTDYSLDCANLGINVVLFNRPWNQSIAHQKITCVNNWDEAIKIINLLSQNN